MEGRGGWRGRVGGREPEQSRVTRELALVNRPTHEEVL